MYLARAAKNIKLVCFSLDQVYAASVQGGPYTEEMAEPGNVYGRQKLEMERRALDIAPESVMLRAEWMYELAIGLLKATGRDLEVFDCPPLHNLWMNCGKARKYGVKFSSVEDGLARCVNDYHNRKL